MHSFCFVLCLVALLFNLSSFSLQGTYVCMLWCLAGICVCGCNEVDGSTTASAPVQSVVVQFEAFDK